MARQRAMNRMADLKFSFNQLNFAEPEPEPGTVSRLVPLWFGPDAEGVPRLLLVRRVRDRTGYRVQGLHVDWPALKAMAEEEVKDLFRGGELKPRREQSAPDPDRALTVLPAVFHPGSNAVPVKVEGFTPLRLGLGLIWLAYFSGAPGDRRGAQEPPGLEPTAP